MSTTLKQIDKEKKNETIKEEVKKLFPEQAQKEVPAMKERVAKFLKKDGLFQKNINKVFPRGEIFKKMGFEQVWDDRVHNTPKSRALYLALEYFQHNPDNPEGVKYYKGKGFYCEKS